jgi:hypothetical protein
VQTTGSRDGICECGGEHEDDITSILDDVCPFDCGFLVMLKVSLDRGLKQDSTDGVISVAAVMFKPIRYKQFVRPWNRMLKPWGATAFHSTDFYNGAEEFKRDTPERCDLFDQDSKRIPGMISDHIHNILLVSFRPEEFNNVASPVWKEKFGTSVHSHAVQLLLISNGWWRMERCPHERFAYFMETGDTDEGEVVKTVERMRNDRETGTGDVIGVSSFTPIDKGKARGLEAADFAAWHWNKWYMDKLRKGNGLNPRKDFFAFAEATAGKFRTIFATGDKLKYFFSLVPPSALEGTDGIFKDGI